VALGVKCGLVLLVGCTSLLILGNMAALLMISGNLAASTDDVWELGAILISGHWGLKNYSSLLGLGRRLWAGLK
jgi:hypothetical protein